MILYMKQHYVIHRVQLYYMVTGIRAPENSSEYVTLYEVTWSSLTHSEPYDTYHPNLTSSYCADEYDPSVTDMIRDNMFGAVSIDCSNNTITVDSRKADSSSGSTYHGDPKSSDSGIVLQSQCYKFPSCLSMKRKPAIVIIQIRAH